MKTPYSSRLRLFFLNILSFLLSLTRLQYTHRECCEFARDAIANPWDIVIVPGVPYHPGRWNTIMRARVLWAAYLVKNKLTRQIIFSGAAVHTPYPEAEVMALYAESCGISSECIFTETKAEHSTENVYFSWKQAQALGCSRIALASDPFQTKLLSKFTREKVSPDIGLLPVIYKHIAPLRAPDPSFVAGQVFVNDFEPLHRRERLFTRLHGTFGKRTG